MFGSGGGGCLGMRYITEHISEETIISLKMAKIGPMAKTVKEGGGKASEMLCNFGLVLQGGGFVLILNKKALRKFGTAPNLNI